MDTVILPSVANFKAEAGAFEQDIASVCSGTIDATGVNTLQQGWKDLATAWAALEPYNFGPLNDDVISPRYTFVNSYRIRGTDYSASVRTNLQNQMANNDAINFSSLNFNLVGLLALEVLSYETIETTPSTAAADLVAELNKSSRKCELLAGYAGEITSQANYFSDGWNTDYSYNAVSQGKAFKDIYPTDAALADGSEPIVKLLVTMQSHMDYMKQRNVLSRTAQISDYSYELATAALESVEKSFEGTGSVDSLVQQMVDNGFNGDAQTVRANMSSAKQALTNNNQAEFEIYSGILDGNFKREIPDALGVTLGINFSDGD